MKLTRKERRTRPAQAPRDRIASASSQPGGSESQISPASVDIINSYCTRTLADVYGATSVARRFFCAADCSLTPLVLPLLSKPSSVADMKSIHSSNLIEWL